MIQTKIIATIGPATESAESISALIDAGVDVFRLNFSHGTIEQHGRVFDRVRAISCEKGVFVAVMADLCGPKIRVDPIEDDAFEIAPGDEIDIVSGHVVGNSSRISTNRTELIQELSQGHRLLIDDGQVTLRVSEVMPDRLRCVCEIGGTISTRKGVNLPDSNLAMAPLSDKDREDLAWAIDHGVDYIAMSFVRSASDLRELRILLPPGRDEWRLIAKIETVQAVRHLSEIIREADVVLVARGDLGVEMDPARVPLLQKQITHECSVCGKPVIIATQMLQSMVEQPTPTRAEVSDVANAILDGADCVMLSAETSVGRFPLESVRMMSRIAVETEHFLAQRSVTGDHAAIDALRHTASVVAQGAALLARRLDARVVAVWTQTGNTARLLSKSRLPLPVVGLSPEEHVCRRMALYYGVIPLRLGRDEQILTMLGDVDELLVEKDLAQTGDMAIVIAGTHLQQVGSTNALLIHLVGGVDEGLPQITG